MLRSPDSALPLIQCRVIGGTGRAKIFRLILEFQTQGRMIVRQAQAISPVPTRKS